MSRGCIQVCTALKYYNDKSAGTLLMSYTSGFDSCLFVPKHQILSVSRLDSFKAADDLFLDDLNDGVPVLFLLQSIFPLITGNKFNCTCGMFKQLKSMSKKEYAESNVDETQCKCVDAMFPCFVITTKNIGTVRHCVGDTIKFIVHPSEHEHMERFLAGTDDPMYDFVHHLQYAPPPLAAAAVHGMGTEVAVAKAEFEGAAAKAAAARKRPRDEELPASAQRGLGEFVDQ